MITRRGFVALAAPAFLRADRPETPAAVMAGDVIPGAAMIWSRATEPSRMIVNWSTSESGPVQTITGPHCIAATDFTGRVELTGLPAGTDDPLRRPLSEPPQRARPQRPGARHASARRPRAGKMCASCGRPTRSDRAGESISRGGMRIYDAMAKRSPDLFLHSGDVIYADNPLLPEVKLADGSVWKNIVTEAKSKVAETLDEFRGQFRYNLLDEQSARLLLDGGAGVAVGRPRGDEQLVAGQERRRRPEVQREKCAADGGACRAGIPRICAAAPVGKRDGARLPKIPYGPLLDVFVLDMRSYRGREQVEPAAAAGSRDGVPGASAAGVAAARAARVEGAVEGDRVGHAARAAGPGRQGCGGSAAIRGGRQRRRPAARPRTRDRRAAAVMKRDGSATSCGSRRTSITPPRTITTRARRSSPISMPFWEFISGPMHAGTFGPASYGRHLWAAGDLPESAAEGSGESAAVGRLCSFSARSRSTAGAARWR